MKAVPTWFGPPARPLFGHAHLPDGGTARGMVVMCSPLGREAANALPALQALADQLTASRVAALRFAYAGTGDSAGSLDDPDRVSDWVASIDHAVALARRSTGGPVVLLGMRMGALLALEAIDRGTTVDHLVVWDPYTTGREFFRVERTLLATGYGAPQPEDGSVIGPAFTYSAETVGQLSGLGPGRRRLLPGPAGPGGCAQREPESPPGQAGVVPAQVDRDRGGRAARPVGRPAPDDHPPGHVHQDHRRLDNACRRPL